MNHYVPGNPQEVVGIVRRLCQQLVGGNSLNGPFEEIGVDFENACDIEKVGAHKLSSGYVH
jgi:hypothetical protein